MFLEFGQKIDTRADYISFGVAPAMFILQFFVLQEWYFWGWALNGVFFCYISFKEV